VDYGGHRLEQDRRWHDGYMDRMMRYAPPSARSKHSLDSFDSFDSMNGMDDESFKHTVHVFCERIGQV
jgi:hypothetical protein